MSIFVKHIFDLNEAILIIWLLFSHRHSSTNKSVQATKYDWF